MRRVSPTRKRGKMPLTSFNTFNPKNRIPGGRFAAGYFWFK
jgi:hypothetical protein